MLSIFAEALLEGCERAQDLFLLNRLQGPTSAGETLAAVFDALGIDGEMRLHLERTVADLVPVTGVPVLERTVTASMLSGVLVGLLIADSALPTDDMDLPVARA
jgi:hypothetical protein